MNGLLARSLGGLGQQTKIGDLGVDFLLGAQFVSGVQRDLDVVAHTDAAGGMHRSCIGIGQRELVLSAFLKGLAVQFKACAPLPDRRDLLLKPCNRAIARPVLDNYAAHKHAKVHAWLARNPRWTFHFVPTSCSWLNAVEEGFFAKLTRRRLQRGVFHSLVDLQATINRFITEHKRPRESLFAGLLTQTGSSLPETVAFKSWPQADRPSKFGQR